jgi:FkbM family methyltransferase
MGLAKTMARAFASRLPEREIVRKFPDFKIKLLTSHNIDFKILCGVGHEPKTVAAIRRLVQPGMTALDVGANIGWMTLHLASCVGPTGRVMAFEASDWTYRRLEQNIHLNGFSWVDPVRAAVGPTDSESVELVLPCGYRLDGADTATRQSVPMVRLDTAAGRLNRIDFIKSDTDGYEPGVFEGARAILQRHRPILVFEVAAHYSRASRQGLSKLFNELSNLRYAFENLTGIEIDPAKEMENLEAAKSTEIVARPL